MPRGFDIRLHVSNILDHRQVPLTNELLMTKPNTNTGPGLVIKWSPLVRAYQVTEYIVEWSISPLFSAEFR
jgi:hypothetical protein